MKFAFIHAEKASFPIAPMCRLLGVTRQGYYAYAGRPPPERRPAELTLRAKVATIHEQSRGTYGSPRVLATLRASGFPASKRRVERTMRALGLQARPRLWGGVSGKDKGFLTPSFLLNFFRTAERSGRNGLSQSTIRALVAHRWKSVGGAQSWDMVKEPKLDAWNVGGALSTSGQPLLASLTGRSRRVLGLF